MCRWSGRTFSPSLLALAASLLFSFHLLICHLLRPLLLAVQFFSARQIGLLYLKYLSGLLPFLPLKEAAIEIPLFTPRALKHLRDNRLGM